MADEQAQKPKEAIFLIGMMASGKTTVGRQLAAALGWSFYDVDKEIEARSGVPVAFIFEKEGEAGFRARETRMMAELTAKSRVVVSMGGGAPVFEVNRKLLARGFVVQLVTSVSDVIERTRHDTTRPLLQAPDRIERIRGLMLERAPAYDAASDAKVSTSRSNPAAVVKRILELEAVRRMAAGAHCGDEAEDKA
ncbi:MAG: shikimate kinase [Duodenibacillus sp.]|nr:shikimate kinase [Duodenibacillus sp.]